MRPDRQGVELAAAGRSVTAMRDWRAVNQPITYEEALAAPLRILDV
jgi:hypothetical protein